MYGHYPKKLGADSGYGSLSNYEFYEEHNIQAFVKYQSWNGELSGRNPALYEYLEDGTIPCLGNRKGFEVHIPNRHPKKNGAVFFLVKDCSGCEFMPYCRRFMKEKEGSEKVFEVQPRFMQLKQKARDLLLTPEALKCELIEVVRWKECLGSSNKTWPTLDSEEPQLNELVLSSR